MPAYATVQDVQALMLRTMSSAEEGVCANLLDNAGVIIDAYNADASAEAKKVVSCNMVVRAMGDGESTGVPLGASQGSMTALGYSQSWTMASGGSVGQLYLGKLDKKLLGVGDRIGSYSPTQELAAALPEVWT